MNQKLFFLHYLYLFVLLILIFCRYLVIILFKFSSVPLSSKKNTNNNKKATPRKSAVKLKETKKVYSLKRKYECQSCGKIFLQRYRLIQHFKSTMCFLNDTHELEKEYHKTQLTKPKQNDLELDNDSNLKKENCYICQKPFPSEYFVMRHLKRAHKSYQCFKCPDAIFFTRPEITSHIFREHEEDYTSSSCDSCADAYEIPGVQLINIKQEMIKCTICNKLFVTLNRLQQHHKWHCGINRFTCEFCPKVFATLSKHILHEYMHTGEKPFRCNFCGEWFPSPTSMNIYITYRNLDNFFKRFYLKNNY